MPREISREDLFALVWERPATEVAIVVADQQGKAVRVQVESASMGFHESTLLLHFYGKRFRKDGLLGKQQEYFTITMKAAFGQDTI